MAFPTFPTKPDPWPVRTQDQEAFDIAVAGTFNFYDGLETWAAGFETEADTYAAALVAANLPSLTAQAGKVPFVNLAGTAVELDAPAKIETVTAVNLGRLGNTDTDTNQQAVSDTIDLGSSKTHAIVILGFNRFRATSSSDLQFKSTIRFNGSDLANSIASGNLTGMGDVEHFTNAAMFTTTASGLVGFSLDVQCDTNVELDRAHLQILAMRTA